MSSLSLVVEEWPAWPCQRLGTSLRGAQPAPISNWDNIAFSRLAKRMSAARASSRPMPLVRGYFHFGFRSAQEHSFETGGAVGMYFGTQSLSSARDSARIFEYARLVKLLLRGLAMRTAIARVAPSARIAAGSDFLSVTIRGLSGREGLSAPRGVYPEVFEGRSG